MTITKTEQLTTVWLAHTLILAVVMLIMVFGVGESPPALFVIAESVILIAGASFLFGYTDFVALIDRVLFVSDARGLIRGFELWQRRGYPVAVSLVFVLQYIALTPLLLRTGGPIDSPFALMVLIYAASSVMFARTARGILVCTGLSLAYYTVLAVNYGHSAEQVLPSPAVYVAVMAMALTLLVGTVILGRMYSRQVPASAEEADIDAIHETRRHQDES